MRRCLVSEKGRELVRVSPVPCKASEPSDVMVGQGPGRLHIQKFAWTSSRGDPKPQTERTECTPSAQKGEHQSTPWAYMSPSQAL